MWRSFLNLGTSFTFWLFLVSAVSGVALFFHFEGQVFHSMHEWLSLVLLVPVVVHIVRNWRQLLGYFRKSPVYGAGVIAIVTALIFAWPGLTAGEAGPQRRGPPLSQNAQAIITQVGEAPIGAVADLFGQTEEGLVTELGRLGVPVTDNGQPIGAAIRSAGKDVTETLAALAR